MSISTVARESLPAATGMTWLAFLTHQPPEVVLGAFTGAIVFLLGATNKPKWQWLLLFSVSLMVGLLGASTVASLGQAALNLIRLPDVVFPQGLSAMLSAACVVNVVIWLRDNPTFFLRKGKEPSA